MPVTSTTTPATAATWPRHLLNLAERTRLEHGDARALRQVVAELAWLACDPRRVAGYGPAPGADTPAPAELGDDLKRWPPGARYAVADLERAGSCRVAAVASVRALPGAPGLHWDRQRWPPATFESFWAAVRDLNRPARETGGAVEGKAPFALEDAERAVREVQK